MMKHTSKHIKILRDEKEETLSSSRLIIFYSSRLNNRLIQEVYPEKKITAIRIMKPEIW